MRFYYSKLNCPQVPTTEDITGCQGSAAVLQDRGNKKESTSVSIYKRHLSVSHYTHARKSNAFRWLLGQPDANIYATAAIGHEVTRAEASHCWCSQLRWSWGGSSLEITLKMKHSVKTEPVEPPPNWDFCWNGKNDCEYFCKTQTVALGDPNI